MMAEPDPVHVVPHGSVTEVPAALIGPFVQHERRATPRDEFLPTPRIADHNEVHIPADNDHDLYVGAIVTSTGVTVTPLDLKPDQVNIEDIAIALSNVCRYAGHLGRAWSVGQHSLQVAALLEARGFDHAMELTGLLHDSAEAYLGDMVRPLKRMAAMKWFCDLENKALQTIHGVLGGLWPHPEPVRAADLAVYQWEQFALRHRTPPLEEYFEVAPLRYCGEMTPREVRFAFIHEYEYLRDQIAS